MDSFETARLRMRPLDASDEALYCALYTTPGLMRFIATCVVLFSPSIG